MKRQRFVSQNAYPFGVSRHNGRDRSSAPRFAGSTEVMRPFPHPNAMETALIGFAGDLNALAKRGRRNHPNADAIGLKQLIVLQDFA
jgi:hypothetical protein